MGISLGTLEIRISINCNLYASDENNTLTYTQVISRARKWYAVICNPTPQVMEGNIDPQMAKCFINGSMKNRQKPRPDTEPPKKSRVTFSEPQGFSRSQVAQTQTSQSQIDCSKCKSKLKVTVNCYYVPLTVTNWRTF